MNLAEYVTARYRVADDGCWIWLLSTNRYGYGQAKCSGRSGLAHRFSYEAFVGPVPDGLQLDHLCRNRACVNPAHLEPVTLQENVRRGANFIAENARKTKCVNGHPFTEENTYSMNDRGGRACKECRRNAVRRMRDRRKAAAA